MTADHDARPPSDHAPRTDAIIEALRRELRELRPPLSPDASPGGGDSSPEPLHPGGLRQLAQDVEARWVIAPRPFASRLPLVGPFVARFRSLWNDMSTRWYVEPVIEQQREFNAAVVRLTRQMVNVLNALESEARYTWADAVPHDRLAATLARTTAQLEAVLGRIDERLQAVEAEAKDAKLAGINARLARLEAAAQTAEGGRQKADGPDAHLLPEGGGTLASPPQSSILSPQSYLRFEERFRGPSEGVLARQRPYLEYLAGLEPVVDLGCGRGEFLALLKEAGVRAQGVDSDPAMVARCRDLGLDVTQGNLLDFLAAQDDNSLGGVFSAQVVEHLPPPALTALVVLSFQKLKPGGMLIAETINPLCLLALAHNYMLDLSHVQPVHPETLAFLAEASGFVDVRMRYGSPVPEMARLQPLPPAPAPEEWRAVMNDNLKKLNEFLYGYQDYAVIARRPDAL